MCYLSGRNLGSRLLLLGHALSWPAVPKKKRVLPPRHSVLPALYPLRAARIADCLFTAQSPPFFYAPQTQRGARRYTDTDSQIPDRQIHGCSCCGAGWWTFAGSSCAFVGSVPLCATNGNADRQRAPSDEAMTKAAAITAPPEAASATETTATSDDDVAFLETMKQTEPGTHPSRVRWQLCLSLLRYLWLCPFVPHPFFYLLPFHIYLTCIWIMSKQPKEHKAKQNKKVRETRNQATLALIHNYFYVSALIKSCICIWALYIFFLYYIFYSWPLHLPLGLNLALSFAFHIRIRIRTPFSISNVAPTAHFRSRLNGPTFSAPLCILWLLIAVLNYWMESNNKLDAIRLRPKFALIERKQRKFSSKYAWMAIAKVCSTNSTSLHKLNSFSVIAI